MHPEHELRVWAFGVGKGDFRREVVQQMGPLAIPAPREFVSRDSRNVVEPGGNREGRLHDVVPREPKKAEIERTPDLQLGLAAKALRRTGFNFETQKLGVLPSYGRKSARDGAPENLGIPPVDIPDRCRPDKAILALGDIGEAERFARRRRGLASSEDEDRTLAVTRTTKPMPVDRKKCFQPALRPVPKPEEFRPPSPKFIEGRCGTTWSALRSFS